MSDCAWVAKIQDVETNQVTRYPFRYYAFGSNEEAQTAIQTYLSYAKVLEVSKNPYEWRELRK